LTLRTGSRPRLWIVAGPNGCGKSTLYGNCEISQLDGSVWIINPDILTATLREREGLQGGEANLQAVKRIEQWLRKSIEVYQTIGVETVLSTGKYRKLVRLAKRKGFEIRLIYAIVDSVELQLERIKLRVAKGGHDVPADKVAARRARSLEQLKWFFWEADAVWIYDNSSAEPQLLVKRDKARGFISARTPVELRQAIGF
jgi:predicted ABC-type ATPase